MSESPVSALGAMLSGMSPKLDDRPYSFALLDEGEQIPDFAFAFAVIRENEGTTVVLPKEQAESQFARITLQVHSDLEGVGLTAAVSAALAKAGIACNVIAGYYHDHLFVPWERRDEAMTLLIALSEKPRGGG
ncbi:MAG: ACT domain-containing protein [Erythrobacter sp.]|uniref:ACT domain-containing protein n=1 Tax=Erythrobacter sp. TaxID=1042 RepID=UPI003267A9C3